MTLNQPGIYGFVPVAGARLAYESRGEGPAIVLVHGGLLDQRMWDDQVPAFSEQYQVIRYDMRCSGKSQAEATAAGTAYIPYQDLLEVLHALNSDRCTLIGHSLGARLVVDVALANPELVQNLVVVSPAVSGFAFQDPWIEARNGEFAQALMAGNISQAVDVAMTLWAIGPHRRAEDLPVALQDRMRMMVRQSIEQGVVSLLMQMQELEPPAIGRLADIQARTLIVLGEQDATDIHQLGKLLAQQVPSAASVTIEKVAHPLPMEAPSEFNSLVDRFLKS